MANRRKTKEKFDAQISAKYNEDLESLDFQTTKHPVTIRCKNCGYTQFFTRASNFIYCAASERKGFCPNCRKEKRDNKFTHTKFLEEVKKRNFYADKFEFLSEYTNRESLIKVHCKKCDSIYERNARAFLLNRDCPVCSYRKSNGENAIMLILSKHNIPFINNYVDTRLDNRKSFDFKIEYNNQIMYIEYDGIQHFEYNEFLHKGDIKMFYRQQENDKIKTDFCKQHNIPLLRVRYDEEHLETTILNFIFESSTTIA